MRCETSAAEQDLIHERADSSQTVSAIENKAESFSKRLEGAENKFAALQISCAGYVGMFNMLLKENKVLQYEMDNADNEARNGNSKNSSGHLRQLKEGKGMLSLHSSLRICSSGGGLGTDCFDLCQGSTTEKQYNLQQSVMLLREPLHSDGKLPVIRLSQSCLKAGELTPPSTHFFCLQCKMQFFNLAFSNNLCKLPQSFCGAASYVWDEMELFKGCCDSCMDGKHPQSDK